MRILLSILLASSALLLGNTGSITGVVPIPATKVSSVSMEKYRGKISGKVAPRPSTIAAVWLTSPTLSAPAKPKPVILAQKNYQFSKSLIVIPKGTTVTFPNNDPDYHNIYSLSKTKRFDLGRYKAMENPAPKVLFDKLGFVALRCEIHDHMNANVIVVDSPYAITTDASGKFILKNVPPGDYTIHAQIDRKTSWKVPVQVRAKKTSKILFPAK